MHLWLRRSCAAAAVVGFLTAACGASLATSITVAPPDTSVTIGDTVVLRIALSAYPDLKGCDLIYAFTSPMLQFVGAQAGDAVAGGGAGFFDYVLPDHAAPTDSVWYDDAVLNGSGAGPGVIAFFAFRAIAEGDAFLTCRDADLRDSFNRQTLPACGGGVIHILGPTTVSRMSWGRLKTVYR